MSCRDILIIGLVLIGSLNFMGCSSDEKKSKIGFFVVSNMTDYLIKNSETKTNPLIVETAKTNVFHMQRIYRIGARMWGKKISFSSMETLRNLYNNNFCS